MMPFQTYVIIGRGVAGITAAQEIRRLDPNNAVYLIGNEPYYYRGSLSEWLSRKTSEAMLPGRTPEFYRQLKLELLDGRVKEVDPDHGCVRLMDGGSITYDRLLIATGAEARQFPIPGLEEQESIVFRSLGDVRTIREKVGCCGRVLILGGGVLGLELAGALVSMGGKKVAVVQLLPYMGAPLLDERSGRWLEKRMSAAGVELFLEDTVIEVCNGEALLRSGQTWPYDLFIQAVGVAPSFPVVPGIDTGHGIRIDKQCSTNLSRIYAAGDCTETKHAASGDWIPTRTWQEGSCQGKTAGRNMVFSGSEELEDKPFYNASVFFDTFYSYIGEPNGEGGQVYWWETKTGLRKMRVIDGKLVGALLLGNRRSALAVFEAVGADLSPHGDAVAAPEFPWNDLGESSWTYNFY